MRKDLGAVLMQAGHDTPGAARTTVAALVQLRRDVDQSTVEAVGRARALGVTWDEIAAAAGVTRPAVIARFGTDR